MDKWLRSRPAVAFALAAVVSLAILAVRVSGLLEALELGIYDRLLRLRPAPASARERVVVVGLTEQDIMQHGWWPLPDGVLARVLKNVLEAGARGVGVDLFRDIPIPPGSEGLEALLLRDSRVVMVHLHEDEGTPAIPPPSALAGSGQVGLADMKLDRDDTIRRALLYLDDEEEGIQLSLALQVALRWLEGSGVELTTDPYDESQIRLGPSTLTRFGSEDGGYVRADAGGYQIMIEFDGIEPSHTVSMGDLLAGRVDPGTFRDKMVFVGYVAESVSDLRRVPFGLWPGVHLHAHIASQLVRHGLGEERPLSAATQPAESAWIVFWALLGAGVGLLRPPVWLLATTLVTGLLALVGMGWGALLAGWWIPVAPPGLSWLIAAGAVETYLARAERRERDRLMGLFARHVSARVARELWDRRDEFLEGGRPRPQTLVATVVFFDVKSFTPLAEKLGALETTNWINELMDMLADEVERQGGFVDDYFGDGLKAGFGLPVSRETEALRDADAKAAVRCALASRERLAELNARWIAEGKPEGALRVGIHSGPVVAASIGSSQRLKYTALGDTVNTAARIENLDDSGHDFEQRPVRILVSQSTLERLGGAFAALPLGAVALKGKEERIPVFEILGDAGSEPAVDHQEG